jgi:RNA polymerase sigma-70 factor (ECF subfamily)
VNNDYAISLNVKSNQVQEMAVKGDATAINKLFAPCIPRLQRVAARFFYNEQDSEDALQDGLLSAFRHLDQFQGEAQFNTWVHSIVVNAAKSKLRKQLSRPFIVSLDEPLFDSHGACVGDKVADPRPRFDEQYERMEDYRILAEVIRGLPPTWREVIRLRDIEGLRMKDIAARLGVSVSAAKTRHFRATHRIVTMAKKKASGRKANCKRSIGDEVKESSPAAENPVRFRNDYALPADSCD